MKKEKKEKKKELQCVSGKGHTDTAFAVAPRALPVVA